jgi:hypothetical protein
MSLVINAKDLATASPKTRRAMVYWYELKDMSLDCVFSAGNTREFRLMVEASVLQDHRFDMLPAYRQVALDAYIQGAVDALSRMKGLPVSQPPDFLRPKKARPAKRSERPQASIGEATTYSNVWPRLDALAAAARRPTGTD